VKRRKSSNTKGDASQRWRRVTSYRCCSANTRYGTLVITQTHACIYDNNMCTQILSRLEALPTVQLGGVSRQKSQYFQSVYQNHRLKNNHPCVNSSEDVLKSGMSPIREHDFFFFSPSVNLSPLVRRRSLNPREKSPCRYLHPLIFAVRVHPQSP